MVFLTFFCLFEGINWLGMYPEGWNWFFHIEIGKCFEGLSTVLLFGSLGMLSDDPRVHWKSSSHALLLMYADNGIIWFSKFFILFYSRDPLITVLWTNGATRRLWFSFLIEARLVSLLLSSLLLSSLLLLVRQCWNARDDLLKVWFITKIRRVDTVLVWAMYIV